MALFVQIDHFRKTDQKPTVKNHLFSISWFRSFNRTSFQQQLKHAVTKEALEKRSSFNRTSFQQQLKPLASYLKRIGGLLQSYILSTTTETFIAHLKNIPGHRFNRTSFQQQLKHFLRERLKRPSVLQSYILSTTTETQIAALYALAAIGFNRTSFQQQLKLLGKLVNVFVTVGFNRTSFQQQLKLIPKKGKIPPLTKLSLIFNR